MSCLTSTFIEGLMDEEQSTATLLGHTSEILAAVKVFPLIPSIKRDVEKDIDTALSWEQLTASDINFAIVRPLVFKYARLDNMAVVYACFVVRSHFLSAAQEDLAYSGVMLSRASLCEILAMKLLNTFAATRICLAATLTASWSPLAGAPPETVQEVRNILGLDEKFDPQCALEMAIATESKAFISSPAVQMVVNDIYGGRMVFSMSSYHSILADNYKPRAIEVYDYRKAPFLDHYRLRVPKYGAVLEFLNFALLLTTFLLCLSNQDVDRMNAFEVVFIIFATAFTLAEYTASREHGWSIYIANMWNVFDTSFVIIFFAYLGFRIRGLTHHDAGASEMSFDILACGACILFPRLAFFAVFNNVVVLALRAMMADFIFFIGIAAICFSGLLFTLHSLAADTWSVKRIAWLMVQIWFGNTYLSFGQAESFHPIFGPILMTMFAALSNTLLLTILISILSNTFAQINANAKQEYLFQYAISTIEGVKSDALFSYQPPFNLLAFAILWPLSFVSTPRALHTANVFLIRLTSFPILIIISIYERYLAEGRKWRESSSDAAHNLYTRLTRKVKHIPILDLLGSGSMDVYDAIFDVELLHEPELFPEDENEDDTPSGSLHAFPSHDSLHPQSTASYHSRPSMETPVIEVEPQTPRQRRHTSLPRSPPLGRSRSMREGVSQTISPRPRKATLSPIVSYSSGEVPTVGPRSPLSRLYSGRGSASAVQLEKVSSASASIDAGVKKMETLLEEVRNLPVKQLKEEMKELQNRQARIENLLLTLTRGMRNDSGYHSSPRNDTL
ncbi:uncharacterized protein LAESUDRAFT_103790 [Laetiporus sulphureus 93-53]|uniref:Uncharacterized protein n=1 Tax=Laetiporus sulphureus 93-53 TaxID=1314785 RepID=A0A165ETI3_9APHY|nr:uncharacterized protein LAESUDRAFT_103790 [Laetiporus sulphureus 93-53]KZT07728.1 hypothetical protein LAESUDRAFT_103790 [Laetiporus sulphureus 93-53]